MLHDCATFVWDCPSPSLHPTPNLRLALWMHGAISASCASRANPSAHFPSGSLLSSHCCRHLPLNIYDCHIFPFPLIQILIFFFFLLPPLQEMIIDKVNGQPVPRYLIYDIIKFNVSSATKECIVTLWDIHSPQVTVCLHSLSFDKGISFGQQKFCWRCQDLYPSITTKSRKSINMELRCLLGNLYIHIFAWVLQRRY